MIRPEPTTVVSALADARRGGPGRPLVTMYDDASGERVELSVTTFDNWVCKLANLFSAEWELDPGELVGVSLPTHWQSTVALVAAWTAGLVVTLEPDAPVDVRVVGPAWTGSTARSGQLLACSLRPFGLPFADPLGPDRLDWATEVPPQPDLLLVPQQVTPATPAMATRGGLLTQRNLVDAALAGAEDLGLAPGGRLLTDLNPADPAGVTAALLAPLVTGSSVVLLVNASEARRAAVAEQERVTCARWSAT